MKAIRYQLLYGIDADAIHRATMRAVDGAEQVCTQLDEARTILQRVNAEKQKQP
jgi:iron complex transport system substrate-binding protein